MFFQKNCFKTKKPRETKKMLYHQAQIWSFFVEDFFVKTTHMKFYIFNDKISGDP